MPSLIFYPLLPYLSIVQHPVTTNCHGQSYRSPQQVWSFSYPHHREGKRWEDNPLEESMQLYRRSWDLQSVRRKGNERNKSIHLILTRSIAARPHPSAGVIGGMNHNPAQVHSCLLLRSVDCTISITNSYSKVILNSFFTILVDSNQALWVKSRQWTLSSRNEPEAWTCHPNCMQYGLALTIWFSGKLRELTLGIHSPRTPTGLY